MKSPDFKGILKRRCVIYFQNEKEVFQFEKIELIQLRE